MKKHAPATQRNREFILPLLLQYLPKHGTVLEIASGSGEHAIHFAPALAPRRYQPTDAGPEQIASIAAWRQEHHCEHLLPPIQLDVTETIWPVEPAGQETTDSQDFTAIINCNMIHIAPWNVAEGLMAGAERVLPSGGVLFMYGPFKRHGKHTSTSNEAFDISLQQRNPSWGVRNLEAVTELALGHQFTLEAIHEMPANNLSLIFIKQ